MLESGKPPEIVVRGAELAIKLQRSLAAISASSISSASRRALFLSMPGSNPPRDTGRTFFGQRFSRAGQFRITVIGLVRSSLTLIRKRCSPRMTAKLWIDDQMRYPG